MIDQPLGDKPALTVVIQSWWTPALAVLMLVVGLLAGYFGHPLLNNGSAESGDIASVVSPTTAVSTRQAAAPTSQAAGPTTVVDPTMAAITSQEQLMEYLVSNTTHFKGDPDATVTIIEFSDYQ